MKRTSNEALRRIQSKSRVPRTAAQAAMLAGALTIGAAPQVPVSPAIAQATESQLPAPPASGVMGFVVFHFVHSVIQGKDACPEGVARQNREIFLSSLAPEESERLAK